MAIEAEEEIAAPISELDALARVTANIQENLGCEDVKLSVTDLIRLLGLRRELAQPQSKRLRVGWVDGCQQTSANEE